MNKQYNVDDILLEIKSKKSKQPAASVPAGFPLKKAEPVKAELPKEEPVKAEAPKSTVQDDFFLKFKEQEPKQEAPKPVEAPKAEENNVFSFNKAVSAPKVEEAAPVKKKEAFKITLPDEAEDIPDLKPKGDLDYNKYFTSVKEDEEQFYKVNFQN